MTERTFFRYFASKDDLVANDMSEWLQILESALFATDPHLPVLIGIEQAVLVALEKPGPISGWLFPSDSSGVSGSKTTATSGVASQIAEIILRWLPPTESREALDGPHPTAARRIDDKFQATVLARTSVGIVRTAILSESQSAALNGRAASLDGIKRYVVRGFALVASGSVDAR